MERLTFKSRTGKVGLSRNYPYPPIAPEHREEAQPALDSLWEYESIGTSEQITTMQKENAELRKKIADGVMVELPCKVGDMLWFVAISHEPREMEVEAIYYTRLKGRYEFGIRPKDLIAQYTFNKTAFLTLEKMLESTAEAAKEPLFDEQKCRVCGCTDSHACPGGCYWVEPDLCSQCAEKEAAKAGEGE